MSISTGRSADEYVVIVTVRVSIDPSECVTWDIEVICANHEDEACA